MGALLQRVAGIDRYTFSTLFMVGIPLLAGPRARRRVLSQPSRPGRDPHGDARGGRAVPVDAVHRLPRQRDGPVPAVPRRSRSSHEARTSWGARTALFLIGMAAAFTHPTTCVIFGGILLSVFGWHFLTSRFSFGSALKADGPMLMSVGFGMIAGLSCWVIGIWGSSASLAEAALPPPYTAEFFAARLREWTLSMQPDRDRAVHRDRDRLHDLARAPARGPARTEDLALDLVAARVRRRAHGDHRQGDPVLPLHERIRGADRARRARQLRRDPLVLLRSRALETDGLGRGRARRVGSARVRDPEGHDRPADRRGGGVPAQRARRRDPRGVAARRRSSRSAASVAT